MYKSIPLAFTVFAISIINVNAQTDVKPPYDNPDPVVESVEIPFMGCISETNPSATIAEIEALLGMSLQACITNLQSMLANDPNNLRLAEQIASYQGILNGGVPFQPTIIEH